MCCCSDHANLLKETLEKQFELVKNRTSRNGSYIQGSHVLQFGSLSIDEEPAADYLGKANTGHLYSRPLCHHPCTLLRRQAPCLQQDDLLHTKLQTLS